MQWDDMKCGTFCVYGRYSDVQQDLFCLLEPVHLRISYQIWKLLFFQKRKLNPSLMLSMLQSHIKFRTEATEKRSRRTSVGTSLCHDAKPSQQKASMDGRMARGREKRGGFAVRIYFPVAAAATHWCCCWFHRCRHWQANLLFHSDSFNLRDAARERKKSCFARVTEPARKKAPNAEKKSPGKKGAFPVCNIGIGNAISSFSPFAVKKTIRTRELDRDGCCWICGRQVSSIIIGKWLFLSFLKGFLRRRIGSLKGLFHWMGFEVPCVHAKKISIQFLVPP